MHHLPLSLLLVAAVAAPAIAEPEPAKPVEIKQLEVRQHSASSPKAGCSQFTAALPCEGLERYRIGMGTTAAAYLDDRTGLGPVVSYQVVSQQMGAQLSSQAIAGLGVRKNLGRGWLQGGPGIARTGVVPGPRSVGIMATLGDPRLAMTGGVGMYVDLAADEPASLALDFGTSIEGEPGEAQIYQLGASVVQRF